ncbi:hypothetical protein [Bacillus sp. FJAT-27245]|uniref:hypothetical protein n=1 Tax=Bacillus sp. FJAT-27245 TaxID=1684144 RepID=UPI0006A7CEAF|nr:hypothetical protein [Bacillus sp. FJAT-27245]
MSYLVFTKYFVDRFNEIIDYKGKSESIFKVWSMIREIDQLGEDFLDSPYLERINIDNEDVFLIQSNELRLLAQLKTDKLEFLTIYEFGEEVYNHMMDIIVDDTKKKALANNYA